MIIKDISVNNRGVTDLSELFGIEIEVENCQPPDCDGTIWSMVEDGSLRNGGYEFVSRPCTYLDACSGIEQFYHWKMMHQYETNIRTSMHVHVNTLGYTLEEVGACMTAYSIIEPLLFRICGREREENIYCVPWYRGAGETDIVSELVQGRARRLSYACKYSAMYLGPLETFGTVEFRHAPVFENAQEMNFWVDMIRTFMQSARMMGTGEEVMRRLDEGGVAAFVDSMWGRDLGARLATYCETSFEDIIDESDSVSIAEQCVPSASTYQLADDWNITLVITGEQQEGYHRVRAMARGGHPMYSPEEMDEAPEYDSDGIEFNEEEW